MTEHPSSALLSRPDSAIQTALLETARAEAYVAASRSEATRRAYAADWAGFTLWCEARGLMALPAAPRTVAVFVADLADSRKPSTLARKLAAISVAHKAASYPTPIGDELVRSTMSGIRRTHGIAQTKKTPIRVSQLRAAMPEWADDLRGLRDRALVLVGYAGGFRRSELVALDVADVELVPEGAILMVRRSKTDQEGLGHRKAIHYGKSPLTCPVTALRAWLREAKIVDGPVFRSIDRWGKVGQRRLTAQVVATVVKKSARLFGLDPDRLGAHSLRAGLVTDGYASGVAEADIMRQTGHRSRVVLEGYYREANLFRGNVSERVGL